jgi:hypothetical protein
LNFNSSSTANFINENNPDFSGFININGGRVIINAAYNQALGTADVTISDGGILQQSYNTSDSYTLSNNITLIGDGGGNNGAINLHDFAGGTSTLTFTGRITLTGGAKIDLDNANAIFLSRPVGCGYSISKSSGSSSSGGSLTGNLDGSCLPLPTSDYTWTEQTGSISGSWQMIAGSHNGKYLVSVIYGSYVYTSSDYGVTWTAQTSAGTHDWVGAASSADGSHLAVGAVGGHIWTSGDYGVTWVERTAMGSATWQCIAMSADASRLAIVAYGGDIWTSSDYGVTWTERASVGSQQWNFVASSADGSHLAGTVQGGYIWTSSDYGVTWTERTSGGYANWTGIAMSGDGKYLVALENGGDIWTSSDYGVTWLDPPGVHAWYGVFMSANGSRIFATASPGRIWTAYDPALDIANQVTAPNTGYGSPSASQNLLAIIATGMIGLGFFQLNKWRLNRS